MQTFNHFSYIRNEIHFVLRTTFLISILCFTSLVGFAALNIHEWESNHRGYSVELVPGTGQNGNPAFYVAAGTVYNDPITTAGWHFMYLDETGTILFERTSFSQVGDEHVFRVVDITCQSPTEFWITIQARNRNAGSEIDYIYLAGVDNFGNDLPMNPAIAIISGTSTHKNLYPTHSYFASNGYLYLCGYAAENSQFPFEPDKFYSDKYGMFLRVDVTTMAHTKYFWDAGSAGGKDYDMALKIAPYEHGIEFPLLVTGAATSASDEWMSVVFVGKFGSNGLPITLNSFLPTINAMSYDPPRPTGVYGVDIRGGVYGGQFSSDPDIIVLVNYFDSDVSAIPRTYGVGRIKNNLTTYPGSVQSYKYVQESDLWGKQFLELHGDSYSSTADNHIYIVGETVKLGRGAVLTSGSSVPGLKNVNPFTAYFSATDGWSPSSGFSALPMTYRKTYFSSEGTSSQTLDYYLGTLGVGAMREDITRLYTFSSIGNFYDDPNVLNPPQHEPAMVLPFGDPYSETGFPADYYLMTKHLKTYNPTYDEPNCNKTGQDILRNGLSDVFSFANYQSVQYDNVNVSDGYMIFTLNNLYNIPNIVGCSNNYHKPGKTTSIEEVGTEKAITLYPNPASTELTVNFGVAEGAYTFILTDVAGKVVVNTSGNIYNNTAYITLPQLTHGMYFATVHTGGKTHTEKVTIE